MSKRRTELRSAQVSTTSTSPLLAEQVVTQLGEPRFTEILEGISVKEGLKVVHLGEKTPLGRFSILEVQLCGSTLSEATLAGLKKAVPKAKHLAIKVPYWALDEARKNVLLQKLDQNSADLVRKVWTFVQDFLRQIGEKVRMVKLRTMSVILPKKYGDNLYSQDFALIAI